MVEKTLAHSAAVGSYPNFPVLAPESVVYSCQIDSPEEIYVQQGTNLLNFLIRMMKRDLKNGNIVKKSRTQEERRPNKLPLND